MVLVVTNCKDETVDYIEKRFKKPIFRFNTDDLIKGYDLTYTENEFSIKNRNTGDEVNNKNLVGVLYRRPVNPKVELNDTNIELIEELSFEARIQYENIISVLQCKWISNPFNIRKAENKILQLKTAKEIGLNIPEYYIGNDEKTLNNFIDSKQKYCIKPLYLGPYTNNNKDYVPYNSIINNYDDFALVKNYPAFIQRYINKKYEYRLTIIGERYYCVKIDSQRNQITKEDWRVENCMAVDYEISELPKGIIDKCKNLLNIFNINYSAIDIIEDEEGEYFFIDLNPNGQWAWIDEKLDLNMTIAFEEFFYGK